MKFNRPPIESYVRVSVEAHQHCFEPAVEWKDGDQFTSMVAALRLIARVSGGVAGDPMTRAKSIGRGIAAQWPRRAYFVECWPSKGDGFAQVFQPFGLPQNRAA